MTMSPQDTQSVLELLADIRRTQRRIFERMSDHRLDALQFGNETSDLAERVAELRSAVLAEPTNLQVAGLIRDVKEFQADVSALRKRIDELVDMTGGAKTKMADIKTTLDIIQSRFEESAV